MSQGSEPILRLTDRQQQAASHSLAPLMILAGAGTGKTTTLIHRIIHLIAEDHLPPESILALTFSEKAAAELRQRIEDAAIHHGMAGWGQTLTATTFHAFCYQTVLEFLPEFRSRRLMNDGDILFLLREHYGELDDLQSETFRREPTKAILAFKSFFDRLRDELIQPADFPTLMERAQSRLSDQAEEGWVELLLQLQDQCRVFPRYQQWKAEESLIDYGDMVYECWRLLESDAQALATLQQRYRTIIVDEFQDNNYALNMIIGHLAQHHHSVTVVGDDDQCIYSFRGASAYNIHDFRDRYGALPGYGEIILDHNHRSLQPILDLANEVIRPNTGRQDKNLVAVKAVLGSPRPRLLIGSPQAQIKAMAERILELVDSGICALDEIAVLVRTHSHAAEVVSGLAVCDIPSRHLHVKFFQLPAIRTALAWCALITETPQATMALYRLLGTYFGPVSRTELDQIFTQLYDRTAGEPSSASEIPRAPFRDRDEFVAAVRTLRTESRDSDAAHMVWRILETGALYRTHFRAGYLEDQVALANLTCFLELAREFATRREDPGLPRFARYMEVLQEADAVEASIPLKEPADAVQVITVHAAKGQEFPVVFLPFMQSGRFPLNYRPPEVVDTPPADWHPWQLEHPLEGKAAHLEEERRLFYVAITRAREQCIILTTPQRRSPFIRDLPEGLVAERELMEPEPHTPSGLPERVTTELKQRLAQELSRGAWDQTHQLVDAIRLVEEFKQGLQPDLSTHPLGAQLQQLLHLPDAGEIPAPVRESLSLSASAIGNYETCPLLYRFAAVDRIPGKEDKPYFTFGRVIHAVLEAYHQPGGDHHGRPLLELLDEKWESEGFAYPQEEAQYREDAKRLLTAYEQALATPPPVLAVEHRFSFPLDDITLTGRIDRIDLDDKGRAALVDYKTSRRRMTEKEAAADPQLALYALYMRQTGEIEDRKITIRIEEMDLIYYFLRSDEPQVVVHMDDATLDTFLERVAQVADGIRRRQFPHRKGYHCRFCDYRDLICPAWEKESLA